MPIKIPTIVKLVNIDQPPWLTNGSVIPVMGVSFKTPAIFTNA